MNIILVHCPDFTRYTKKEGLDKMEELFNQAIQYAAQKHNGQVRKATDIPYITHPFAVAMMLQQAGCKKEVVLAGLLHDTLEDTSATEEEIQALFGDEVLALVISASEPDKSLPWEERKRHTLAELASRTVDEMAVIIADKLHNLRSIRADIEVDGESVWSRFNRGKEQQSWYYQGILHAAAGKKDRLPLIAELEAEVRAVFLDK